MIASKLLSVGSIIISLCAGLITFYVMSDLSKEKKKVLLEEMVIQLTSFIIFIWIGKIILNISSFIKSPLAILAYPSDSGAFYLAVLFSAILIGYKSMRQKIDAALLIGTFMPVFFVASFLFEFIQLIWNDSTYALGNMTLFTVLVVVYFLIRDQISHMLMGVMLIGWSVGSLVLSFMQPYATLFGFIMAPWFVGVFFIVSLSIIIYTTYGRINRESN